MIEEVIDSGDWRSAVKWAKALKRNLPDAILPQSKEWGSGPLGRIRDLGLEEISEIVYLHPATTGDTI